MKRALLKSACLIFFVAAIHSCKTTEVMFPSEEFNGKWALDSIVQNSQDITRWFNTNDFQITFQTSDNPEMGLMGNYQLAANAPFPIHDNGTWSLDHPKIPIMLMLKEEGTEDAIPVQFYFPPKGGGNVLQLIAFPGCESNRYEYFFRKVN